MRKRVLSLLLSVCMVLVLFPTVASANGNYNVEGRTATLTANDVASLQSALSDSGVDEVVIGAAITLPNGTILDGGEKTVRVPSPYVNEDGTKNSSASNFRVFNVENGSKVSISNMTIMDGYRGTGADGAIVSYGNITLENVTFTRSNRGLREENGIAVLKNCNFVMNVSESAGAIWCGGGAEVVLDGCSFTNNHSSGTGGGGAIGVSGSSLYANNTVFANNATGEIGGAINLYGGSANLINCTFTGNVTDSPVTYGGAIGNNGGYLYAANCIFVDNYASITGSLERSDVDNYNSANSVLYNCLYGTTNGPSGTNITATDCKTDTGNETAFSYVNTGVTLSSGSTSGSFTHPDLASGTNAYAKYVPVNATGPAITGGIATYFDYSDLSDIKMGYGAPGSITGLGGLTAPDSNKKVTTYFEGGTRSDGVIGASAPKAAFAADDFTVTNGTPESDKETNHGYIAIDKATAAEGETVTVTVAPSAGYQLKAGTLKVNDGAVTITCKGIGKYEFTMPKEDVAVTAEFEQIVLPYFFDFESDFIAAGWTNIDADGDGQDWITGTNKYGAEGFGVEGSRCAISQSYENENEQAFDADNWLFSPAITIPAGGATVSWYEQSQDPDWPDFYEVYVSETNTEIDLSKMTLIFDGFAANPWMPRSVELEAAEYAGKTVYIAFRHNCSNHYMLEIDDFAVEAVAPAHTYTVTFDANGGSVTPTSAETGTDGKLATLPTPTRSGSYSFDGWYTAASGGTKVDTNTVFTAAATIYAHWSWSFSFADLPETGVTNITVPEGDYYTGLAAKDAFILYWGENINKDGDFILIDYFYTYNDGYHSWMITFENDDAVATDGGFMEYYTTLDLINSTRSDCWINGTYSAIHTVTVENDGNGTASADTSSAAKGETVTLTATPNTGYHFKEWQSSDVTVSGDAFTMPEKDVTVKAIFEENTYTVTVENDGNGSASADKTSAAKGETVTLTATPNTGYHFKEWQSSDVTVSGDAFTMLEKDVTVKAIFEADATVTIPSIDITNADITPVLGEKAGDHLAFTLPTGCHYAATMNGWWDIINSKIMANDDVFEAGGLYCASWNFVADDGYAFAADATVTINGSAANVDAEHSYLDTTGDAPLYIVSAKGVLVEATTYTVTFDANGGSVTPTSAVTGTDGKLVSLPTPTRSGSYRFNGWYTAASGGTKVTVDKVYTADTTIYAHWTYTGGGGGGYTPIIYTLTFNTNGGSAISSVSGTYGKVIDLDKYVPTKSGFDFGGWYSDSALTNPVDEIKLNGNKTVYAKWNKENPNTGAELPFTDVVPSAWSYDDIAYVYEKGLMQGTSETTFAPKIDTSRAMIVTILWRLEGEPIVNYAMSFDDVADGQWYTEAIRWAQANNIVNGYSAEKFGPTDFITREQMAAIFYRYAEFKGYDVSAKADLSKFADSDKINGWALDAIAWANANNLVNGVSTTELAPQGKATREQVAAILHRFCENIVK